MYTVGVVKAYQNQYDYFDIDTNNKIGLTSHGKSTVTLWNNNASSSHSKYDAAWPKCRYCLTAVSSEG
jgi:hypothetical protein